MALRNEIFLIGSVRIHNRIVERCFCNRCRDLRLQTVMNAGLSVGQIRDIFDGELFETENQRLDSLFTNTLDQIVHGKALKEQCEALEENTLERGQRTNHCLRT